MSPYIFFLWLCLCLTLVVAAPKRKRPGKVTNNSGKIVGGKDTDISTVPYQVSLQLRNRHICGGSIIGARHILTAAHCVESGRTKDFSIRAGSNYHTTGGEVRRVKKITRHPNYNPTTTNNDAAILELEEPLPTSDKIRIMPWKNKIRIKAFNNDVAVLELAKPLNMNSKIKAVTLSNSEPKSGDEVLISGWGALKEGGGAHLNLQSVTVPTITRQTCQRVYSKYNTITESMFCAGFAKGGKDACQGDSGGPAIVHGRQAGVVSWGAGCARRHAPGVYTNIAIIRPWIESQTQSRG